jgi:hypothetical protein
VIAGPLYDQEGIVAADCDLRAGLHAKRWFDAVGHYGRQDLLGVASPAVGDGAGNTSEQPTTARSTMATE